MNTNHKSHSVLPTIAVAAALLASVGSASAGGQRHVLPADYGKTYPIYEFKIVTESSGTTPLTVQLVNAETGQLVRNAHVSMRHTVWLGIKAVPQFQRTFLALQPDGRGDYVCSRGPLRAGERIVMRAHVPGESSATWETVVVGD